MGISARRVQVSRGRRQPVVLQAAARWRMYSREAAAVAEQSESSHAVFMFELLMAQWQRHDTVVCLSLAMRREAKIAMFYERGACSARRARGEMRRAAGALPSQE